jgi:hypothetical protein
VKTDSKAVRSNGAIGKSLAFAALLSATMGFLQPASAQQYESEAKRSAAKILSADVLQGPHHKVGDSVMAVGYFHVWRVTTDYGHHEVVGDGALRKLIAEVGAIAALKEISRTEAFTKSVAAAAKSPFQFGYSLITEPVDTVTALPSGVFRLFENIGESVTSEKNEAEDSSVKQALQVSSWKRDFAAGAGIDVYSGNTVLQEELNRIGWAAAIGGLTVSAAAMPLTGPAAMVAKNGRLLQQVNGVLASEPPARLRIINEEKLSAMGIPDGLAKQFLDSQVYTPSQSTVLIASLDSLGAKAADRGTVLEQALSAGDEAEAAFYVATAQMLAGYSDKVAGLKRLFGSGRLVMAITQKGRLLVAAPVDRVIWNERTEQVSKLINDVAVRAGVKGKVDLWLTGTASNRAKKELAKRDLAVTDKVSQTLAIFY